MAVQNRVLGLLPARAGSKGIPGKNLKPFLGRPLLAWAASALSRAELVHEKICSTEDIHIAEAAKSYGLEVPWLRPPELARDETLVVDVISHTLRNFKTSFNIDYTHVALVQATSPAVTHHDIDAAIRLALGEDADTVITGFYAGQRHPATMYTVNKSGSVSWLFDQKLRMSRRQDLEPVFIRTGLVYVVKAHVILENSSLYGNKIFSVKVPEERAITIDNEFDFRLAELLMSEGK